MRNELVSMPRFIKFEDKLDTHQSHNGFFKYCWLVLGSCVADPYVAELLCPMSCARFRAFTTLPLHCTLCKHKPDCCFSSKAAVASLVHICPVSSRWAFISPRRSSTLLALAGYTCCANPCVPAALPTCRFLTVGDHLCLELLEQTPLLAQVSQQQPLVSGGGGSSMEH